MNIKKLIYIIGIIAIIAIAGFFMLNGNTTENTFTGNAIKDELNQNAEEVQNIVLSMRNYNYYPNTVRVKAGKPVHISLDESIKGCFRDFTIKDFGIHKYLETPQDYIKFIPTKPGTYVFACSMGMGTGILIVE